MGHAILAFLLALASITEATYFICVALGKKPCSAFIKLIVL